ncbi:MAG: HlyD family efflux transporter periplasmic adaptor subunit [Desulfobacterales bacterium]|nr:MAG: HlyD family efflux transporter periplasmic adaptor subunit [Desulfobacterales bacterium]
MEKGFVFKTLRAFVVLAVAIVIAAGLITLRPRAERQVRTEARRLVEVSSAKSARVPMLIEAFGTVRPREALKLVAQVRGQIVEIDPACQEGCFIARGRNLISIDPRNYQLEVERQEVQIIQAEAELSRLEQEVLNLKASIRIAEADTALARAEFRRLQKLGERKVIAQTTLDNSEQRYLTSLDRLQGLKNQLALTGPRRKQLTAQREMARVMRRQAELDLERTQIAAPFDGWVLEKVIEQGQHVNVGEYLGSIYRAGALDIQVRIPVKDLKWFPAALHPDKPAEAEVVFENDGIRQIWTGRVARTEARMDEKTRTLPMVVEVDQTGPGLGNPERAQLSSKRLRPGMFVKIQIRGREIERAFVLPRHVVHPGDVVYTVVDDRLRIKPVNVLRRFKEEVIVDEGLTEGELLITSPLSGAVDGMRVRMATGDGGPKTADGGQKTEDRRPEKEVRKKIPDDKALRKEAR